MSTAVRRTGAWIGALSLALLVGAQSPAHATEQAPELPAYYVTHPLGSLSSGSSDFVMVDNHQVHETFDRVFTPVRLSDGSPLALPVSSRRGLDEHEYPQIVDDSWLQVVNYWTDPLLERHDVETGQLTGSLEVMNGDVLAHADDEWMLVRSNGVLSFVFFDGSRIDVTATAIGAPVVDFEWVTGDSVAAYLTSGSVSVRIVPATGSVTALTDPDGDAFPIAQASPGRLFGLSPSGNPKVVSWLDDPVHNAGYGSVSVDDPTGRLSVFANGGGAVTVEADIGTPTSFFARDLDLTTGERGDKVVDQATSIIGLGDGSIAAVLTDRPTGRIIRLDGGAPTAVADLPKVAMLPSRIDWSGGRPVVSWANPAVYPTPHELTSLVASQWQPLNYPSADLDEIEDLASGALLTRRGTVYPETTYRVSWPDGSFHDVSARSNSSPPALSSNGRWVQVPTGGTLRYQVQDSRTGTVVATYKGQSDYVRDRRVITRNWLWSTLGQRGNAVARDLTGSGRTLRLQVPLSCHGGPGTLVDVRGRWVVTECDFTHLTVHDRNGAYRSRTLAGDSARPALGDGYLVRAVVTGIGTGDEVFRLRVNSLGADHRARSYGPITWDYLPSFAVDRQGSRAPAYLDDEGGVRRVDLSWLD